jgi:hypothetical protein
MIFNLYGNPLIVFDKFQVVSFVGQRLRHYHPVSLFLVKRSDVQFEIVRVVETVRGWHVEDLSMAEENYGLIVSIHKEDRRSAANDNECPRRLYSSLSTPVALMVSKSELLTGKVCLQSS